VFPVRLSAPRVAVPEAAGFTAAPLVLPGADGFGYGRFELDSASLAYLLAHLPDLQDPVARGAAWVTLWDALLEGQVPPQDLLNLSVRALPLETDELNVQRILSHAEETFWRFLPVDARLERARDLERRLWEGMQAARTPTLKATYFRAYRSAALTPEGIDRLRGIWSRRVTVPGVRLSEDDYTTLALELAVRGVPDAADILRSQERRITNPDRRARFAFVLPALSADTTARDAFFESLKEPANREHEPWVLDGLGYLHHPLRAARAERYILPSLQLLEEIQRTGDIFFPGAWVGATLGGHRSPEAARMVREFLEARPDYPPRLKAKILQEADPLFRAARIAP
jgi:aminopeptidase N